MQTTIGVLAKDYINETSNFSKLSKTLDSNQTNICLIQQALWMVISITFCYTSRTGFWLTICSHHRAIRPFDTEKSSGICHVIFARPANFEVVTSQLCEWIIKLPHI